MYDTTPVSVPKNAEKLFDYLLFFYPSQYRKQFGQEMRMMFYDIYQDELDKKGHIGLSFWLLQFIDITKSVMDQHKELVMKIGMKKYLQQTLRINIYNIAGGIFLLPFIFLFGVDFLGRLVQGDFTHYNKAWYTFISHTFFYGNFPSQIPLMWMFLVFSPIVAVILNLIPLFLNIIKNKKKFMPIKLFIDNPLTIAIIFLSFFCLLVVSSHDFAPCMLHGIIRDGFGQIFHLVAVCRNA